MTISELISALQALPPEAKVYVGLLQPSAVVNVADAYDEDLREPMAIIEADEPS